MKRRSDNIDKLFSFATNENVRAALRKSEPRIRSAFDELFSGYDLSAEDVLNDVARVDGYSGVVTVENINFYSFCEHHFAPFFGMASVSYQPGTVITGLGKIVRLVRDVHARRLQIQEIMTKDIAEDIKRVLGAQGVMVVTKAKHLCICSRGPNDDTAMSVVSYGCGSLSEKSLSSPLKR